ncbi:peptidoglycan-binding protein [Clostridium omnivorum]|uniref:Peptidoglycan-binding protein n=1 Tax=Clostridium omnivorum TaxID=1604902 RepID=A0ABQ5N762_9CLOT|nr:peptidoglycan-binding protein [Clostridium sp. E14]GLC30966.1 hypothetical protein bsdE14_23760 [Clostridium sp. E14]
MYDGRGSVAQLTNSLGQVKDKYSYDPFGNINHGGPLGNSEAHFQSFFGFNGEEYNNISGLQYLRARYYEADTGRFLTRDSYLGSLTEPLSLNRYAYTNNNPVMNIDPSGHRRLSVTGEEEYDLAANPSSYGTLRNGSRYGDVSTLQQLLKNAGFNPGTIDGIFGNNTEKAVRAYQASKGLAVDGIVGNQTWGSLLSGGTSSSSSSSSSSLPSEILRKGSSDPLVKKLQQGLINLGYDLGSYGADGAFGNKTEQAVISFQRDHGLLVDGVVGSQTWGALLGVASPADMGRRDRCSSADYIDSEGTSKQGTTLSPETIKAWDDMNEALNEEGTISNRILNGTFFHIALRYHEFFKNMVLIGMGDNSHEGVVYVTEDQVKLAEAGADISTGELEGMFIGAGINGVIGLKRLMEGEIYFGSQPVAASGMRVISEGGSKATFKNGDLFETAIIGKSGVEIGTLADTIVEGDTLILKDISIYSNVGDIKNAVGAKDFVQMKNQIAQLAKEQGFKTLKILGERVMNSTSANPGHGIDITIDLTKLK